MLARDFFTKERNWIIANLVDLIGYSILKIWNVLYKGNKKTSYPSRVKKILLIRTDGIGDTLVTLPLLKSLKKFFTEAEVDFLLRPKSKKILEENSYVSKIILSRSKWCDFANAIRLRKEQYDIVINPRPDGYFFNHLIVFSIGSKRRLGFAMKGGGFLLTDMIPWDNKKNIIQLLMGVSQLLGENSEDIETNMEIHIGNDANSYVKELLKAKGISSDDFLVGINPFAGHSFIWPIKNYAEVVETLIKQYAAKVIFVGEIKARLKIEEMQKFILFPTFSVAGTTNLKQLFALIEKLHILITVDSAPRHIANAVKTPVITLRHSADSNIIWGSYTPNDHVIYHQVSCAPCGKKFCPENKRICMSSIRPKEVISCANKIIERIKNENRN